MRNTPSIAYLTSEYPALSVTFILREVEALRQKGFQIETVAVNKPKSQVLEVMGEKEKREAENTYYLKSSLLLRAIPDHFSLLLCRPVKYLKTLYCTLRHGFSEPVSFVKVLAYFVEAGCLLAWLRRKKIQHVHVHFGNPAATVALLASYYGSMEYSLSLHGPDIFYDIGSLLLRHKIRRASFVRCISYFCQSQLMQLANYDKWSRFHIVRCGVDPSVFSPRSREREPNNVVPQILCIGRLVPQKGMPILIQACRELHAQGVAFHLTIVGSGPDLVVLQRLVEDEGLGAQVTLAGGAGQDKVHDYYDKCDFFVLPSFAEGVPVVLMEAMAKGIACVSTQITGIPELIDNGRTGLLCVPGDVEGLARQMCRLIQDPSFRKQLGSEARKEVVERYSLEPNCLQMAELFGKYMVRPGLK